MNRLWRLGFFWLAVDWSSLGNGSDGRRRRTERAWVQDCGSHVPWILGCQTRSILILCWGDGAANYSSKLIWWSVNRFLEMSWQGCMPSLDIFNFLDRWTEEGFQLLGGEVGVRGVRIMFPLYGSVAEDPPSPLHLSKFWLRSSSTQIHSESLLCLLFSHFTAFLVFMPVLPSNSKETLLSVQDPKIFLTPYPCRSRKGWSGSGQWLLCFPWRKKPVSGTQRLLFSLSSSS